VPRHGPVGPIIALPHRSPDNCSRPPPVQRGPCVFPAGASPSCCPSRSHHQLERGVVRAAGPWPGSPRRMSAQMGPPFAPEGPACPEVIWCTIAACSGLLNGGLPVFGVRDRLSPQVRTRFGRPCGPAVLASHGTLGPPWVTWGAEHRWLGIVVPSAGRPRAGRKCRSRSRAGGLPWPMSTFPRA